MKINHKKMLEYFREFDSFRHKYFKDNKIGIVPDVLANAVKIFDEGSRSNVNLQEVSEIFRTMDKVYHYGNDAGFAEMNLLEQATDKFLEQYVNIDGLHELFRPSFFNFEWMMHLEYNQKKHDYSYYRDHYMHQIRNMYEMFMLLDDKGMWRDCMEIYKQRKNTVANRMAESVAKQQSMLPYNYIKVLEDSFGNVEDWCYHYIIFSTAIVSSLIHDIGYPIAYMKRNLDTIQDFLPQSSIFMGMKDGIPKIKSLLSSSLLFETVNNDEIIRRLNADDHGVYSAIILLCYYYDNGRIFSLEPAKRMIIELSALVIYNHTLKHHFQDEKNYDRYQSVFTDNPISCLFRLCDDMQEWGRVYFEITGKGNFFICDKCKMPMFRTKNENHCSDVDEQTAVYGYKYECCNCGAKSVNTVRFPYRRMMNVDPFKELTIDDYVDAGVSNNNGTEVEKSDQNKNKADKREEQKWVIELKCNKGELLQLARYNTTFAIQRARGIRELRGLVSGQMKFPRIFIKAFASNNPIAIKTEILREFIHRNDAESNMLREQLVKKCSDSGRYKKYCKIIGDIIAGCSDTRSGCITMDYYEDIFSTECKDIIDGINNALKSLHMCGLIYNIFVKKCDSSCDSSWPLRAKIGLLNSINFYLFMLVFCNIVCGIDFITESDGNIDNGKEKKKQEKYELKLNSRFTEYADGIAKSWGISDSCMTVLIADCITCMYGNISEKDFFNKKSTFRNNLRIPLREDMKEILKYYTRKTDDMTVKSQVYDFWSDYYFFHMMDYLNHREEPST